MEKSNRKIGFVIDTELEGLLYKVCETTKTDKSLLIRTMIYDYIYKNQKHLLTTTK
jgi:hypothetical protein